MLVHTMRVGADVGLWLDGKSEVRGSHSISDRSLCDDGIG